MEILEWIGIGLCRLNAREKWPVSIVPGYVPPSNSLTRTHTHTHKHILTQQRELIKLWWSRPGETTPTAKAPLLVQDRPDSSGENNKRTRWVKERLRLTSNFSSSVGFFFIFFCVFFALSLLLCLPSRCKTRKRRTRGTVLRLPLNLVILAGFTSFLAYTELVQICSPHRVTVWFLN